MPLRKGRQKVAEGKRLAIANDLVFTKKSTSELAKKHDVSHGYVTNVNASVPADVDFAKCPQCGSGWVDMENNKKSEKGCAYCTLTFNEMFEKFRKKKREDAKKNKANK